MYTYCQCTVHSETEELLLWGGGLGGRTESRALSNNRLETLLDRLNGAFAENIMVFDKNQIGATHDWHLLQKRK